MRRIVAFFVDRSLAVNLITVAVIIGGAMVARVTTRAILPREKPRGIDVIARLPGASAVDMERLVTFRLEEALHGMEDVKRVRSVTENGSTEVKIRVKPGIELTKVLEETRSRMSAIIHRLPEDLLPLQIKQEKRTSNQFLMHIIVKGVEPTNAEHRVAVQSLADRLRRVPEVIDVESSLEPFNLYIRFSQRALDEHGIDVTLARQRILEHLGHAAVGEVQVGDQDVAIELHQGTGDPTALRTLPLIVNRVGKGTTLGDVAEVRTGFAEKKERRTIDGRSDFVEIAVINALGSDGITISQRVRALLKAAKLPRGLTMRVGTDASEAIGHEIDTLQNNGLSGVVIVLLILLVFVGWRISLVTAAGLPFAYLGIVLLLPLLSINFNMMSLAAMILVVGILVDDAIIVSEEFCQRVERGQEPREASIRAVTSVARPVLGMVATTTVAFAPLLFIQGEQSWLWRPLPIVVIAALWISAFESFFLLPNHLRHLLRSSRPRERRFVAVLQRIYRGVLGWTLKLRYVSLLAVAGLFGLGAMLFLGPVGFKANESFNSRARLYVELAEPAKSLDDLQRRVRPVEKVIESLPKELLGYYKTDLGYSSTPSWNVVHGFKYALIRVAANGTWTEQEERRFEIARRLEHRLRALEKSEAFARLRFFETAGPDARDVVTVYVSGGDRIDFTEIQQAIRDTLTGVEQIKDVYMDETRFQRSFRFVPHPARVLAYGLTKSRVRAQLREHFSDKDLLRVRRRGEEIEVYLEFADTKAPSLARLGELTVISGKGTAVPLRLLGEWKALEILRRIEHQDLLRMFKIDVLYDRAKTDAARVAQVIEDKLAPLRQRFSGYHISVKPSEVEAENKDWLLTLLAVCGVLIYVCLALSLGSLVHPIVVVFAIPFGFVGAVLAFYLHGMALGMFAGIGLLGLAGVVVNDSLVMTTTISERYREDPTAGLRSAILDGATARFRAVILTSLTTLGGVFPLAYGIAGKAGFMRPMVLAVGWGLAFATLLTLFFIPCLLLIVDDVRRIGRWTRRACFPRRFSSTP